MSPTHAAPVVRLESHPRLRVTERERSFHDRALDGIRKFLQAHPMAGKTGAREFYEFEK